MAEETVKVQAQSVDLDTVDANLVEENITISADANPMEAPAPVNDGVHRVKLVGATEWFQSETVPKKSGGEPTTFFKTQFSGIIVSDDPKENNKRVFGRVNTLTFDGKNEMAYIMLQILGGKDNPEARKYVEGLTNIRDLATAFKQALAGEPIIKLSTKWVAQYKVEEGGKDVYKTYLSGQANFPKVGGVPQHVVNAPRIGEVVAQAQIQDYFPDNA